MATRRTSRTHASSVRSGIARRLYPAPTGLLGPAADAIGRYERIDLYSQLAADTGRGRLPFGEAPSRFGVSSSSASRVGDVTNAYSVVERL